MFIPNRRFPASCFATILIIAAILAGCGKIETGEVLPALPPSLTLSPTVQSTIAPTVHAVGQPTARPTIQPTPTIFTPGPLFDSGLDLMAGPVPVPFELQIPALNVNAPALGVGLNSKYEMDAPKGPIDDPVWHTAFWYRGSGSPGESGTATIAGHVNDPLGRPEIFAQLQELNPGDLIIIHYTLSNVDIRFIVDQVIVYSIAESSDPAVLSLIFGAGPVAGLGPQPAPDGLSHLTLITCAGYIINGEFDHHTVVYATRIE